MSSRTTAARPIRALVIGAGATTNLIHLPILARMRDKGDIVLTQICDIQHQRAAAARRKFGFVEECGDAVAALGRRDLDAVYIFGSAQMHYEYGLLALRTGKHLFVEKPIAPCYAQAHDMAQAAKSAGLIAVGGHNRRFYQSLSEVRAHAGKTGWRFAEAVFHKPEFGKPALFGASSWLTANGIHALDALVFMMGGMPEQMAAFAGETSSLVPSAFSAVMRWPDGAQGAFLCNNNAGARHEEYVFHGLGETYRAAAESLAIEKAGTISRTMFPAIGNGFAAEHEAFIEAINGSAAPAHNISIAALAPSLFLAELIESGFSGRVELPEEIKPKVPPVRSFATKSILIAEPAPTGLLTALERLAPEFRLVSLDTIRTSDGEHPDVGAAIIGHGSPALPVEILDKLPQLGIVGIVGLSVARYEPDALLKRGLVLVNASAAYAESVAEFAFGLAILARRRAFLSHSMMRAGGWELDLGMRSFDGTIRRLARRIRPAIRAAGLEMPFLRVWKKTKPLLNAPDISMVETRELNGAVVGLIGWGANARAFAKRLIQAGARVIVYSEHARECDVGAARLASLAEVLSADIVSLHRGLNPDTRHFLGAAELKKLRPGTVFINVARGALVEPVALLERLRRGDIFACLDSFEQEPLASGHPLRRLPNVFLTSHIAGGSRDMREAASYEVVRKVAAYLKGDLVESIPAERLHTMT